LVIGVDVGIELVSNISSSGLTLEEEESFLKTYNAELASNRVLLCENEIDKINRYIDPEYPEEWKPPRLVEKLVWWKQMLENAQAQNEVNADRLRRENEASKENVKTAKKLEDAIPILEKHSNIGKGPRKHNSLLNNFIDNFDKEFCKNRKKKLSAEGLELKIKEVLTNNLEKYSFVIEAEDVNDCIKWSDDKGKIQSSPWGDAMRARIARIRKKRNPH
jgi:hypothetical protein